MEIVAPFEDIVSAENEDEASPARESNTPETNESSKPDCDEEHYMEWCLTSLADCQISLNLIKEVQKSSGCKSVLPIIFFQGRMRRTETPFEQKQRKPKTDESRKPIRQTRFQRMVFNTSCRFPDLSELH